MMYSGDDRVRRNNLIDLLQVYCEYTYCKNPANYEVTVTRGSERSYTKAMCESHLEDLQTTTSWSDPRVTYEVTHLEPEKV